MIEDSIPDLKIELLDDEPFAGWIMLEQDSGGNVDRVSLHPVQLRYLAEKIGLVPASDPEGARAIATLERRMCLLRDRIDHLGNWMTKYSDHEHADLSYEMAYIEGLAAMADEFCAELDELESVQNQSTSTSNTAAPANELPETTTAR